MIKIPNIKLLKNEQYIKDYLFTEPRLTNNPTKPIPAGLADAHNFALTLSGNPIIQKVEPHAPGKYTYKMTVELPENINMTALLKMWNNTTFNNIIFKVQEFTITIV